MNSNTSPRSALSPLQAATTASADFSLRVPTSAFQPQGEISPGKNALLRCTTAGSTPLRLDHESFAVLCPLALLGSAFYPVLVHRLAASLHASSPRSVSLTPLRFASFAVINSRRDLHTQECAHAGRTQKTPASFGAGVLWGVAVSEGYCRSAANHLPEGLGGTCPRGLPHRFSRRCP